MDVAGLVLACLDAFDVLTRLGLSIHDKAKSAKEFAKNAGRLRIQVADEVQRLQQLRLLLLAPGKIYPEASLFEQMPRDIQEVLVGLIYHIAGPLLGEYGEIWRSYLHDEKSVAEYELSDHLTHKTFDELVADFEASQAKSKNHWSSIALATKIKWAFQDEKRANKIVEELSDATRRIKEDIELYCLPLGILMKRSGAVKNDADTLSLGWSDDAELVRLIIEGNATREPELNTRQLVQDSAYDSHKMSFVTGYYETKPVVIQYKPYKADSDDDAPQSVLESVQQLSSLLRQLKSNKPSKFSVLQFRGYYQEVREKRFAIVFDIPAGYTTASSLKDLLVPENTCSLGYRFRLAHTLASSLSRLHRVRWVHKNVRSENVLFLPEPAQSTTDVGIASGPSGNIYTGPWLVGFTHARREQGETSLLVDTSIERNIYRDPQRWNDPLRYRRIHDIFSLGVLLLEIGTWKTAIAMLPPQIMNALVKVSGTTVSLALRRKVLDSYRGVARSTLVQTMGTGYSEIVLRCLDGDFSVPGEDDAEESQLQRQFWHLVVERLARAAEGL